MLISANTLFEKKLRLEFEIERFMNGRVVFLNKQNSIYVTSKYLRKVSFIKKMYYNRSSSSFGKVMILIGLVAFQRTN